MAAAAAAAAAPKDTVTATPPANDDPAADEPSEPGPLHQWVVLAAYLGPILVALLVAVCLGRLPPLPTFAGIILLAAAVKLSFAAGVPVEIFRGTTD